MSVLTVIILYSVIRNRGHFGNVTVFWQLFANYTPLKLSQEFVNTSGFIVFTTGEKNRPIVLEAISDKLPEFNEFFELRLINISGQHQTANNVFFRKHEKNKYMSFNSILLDQYVSEVGEKLF